MGIPGAIDDIRPFAALAQSATTVVYKAYQSSLERFVLLKRLRAEYSHDADLAARFQEEARIVARIRHPNIVAIHAFGSDTEGAYIVAEFIDGFDLSDLIARSKIPPDVAVHILLETARGLRAAHEKGVLHRDLKPSNILISREGEVKLADFGLASVKDSPDGAENEVRGTLAYIAPEQILGSPADGRSDLFSLGATFFEMLTGRRAFAGTTSKEILDSVLNHHPIKYLPATPGVTPEIKLICARLLERDPGRRFADVSELIESLEAYQATRGRRLTREDLKRYVENPEAFVVTVAPRHEVAPEVTIVPDARRARPPVRRTRRPARSVLAAAATVVLMTVLGYIGLRITEDERLASAHVSSAIQENPFLISIPPDSVLAQNTAHLREISEYTTASKRTLSLANESPESDGTIRPAADSSMVALVGVPAGKGILEISVDPGAGVLIDRDSIGVSSLSYPLLVETEPGTHKITLSNPNFPKWMTEVTVEPGSRTPVKVSLWDFVGRLDLKVSPWAEIFIDDRYIGQSPLEKPIVLMPGTHMLRLENPEMGVSHTTTIEVQAKELVERSFILEELL